MKQKQKELVVKCGSNNKNLQFIICEKAGHIICSDCTLECSDCGKHICILCSIDKCSKCNKILCDDCKIYCYACDKTFCKEDSVSVKDIIHQKQELILKIQWA